MKYLSLLAVLLFSIALQAQTVSTSAGVRSIVTAELTRKIDSKNAHVGDEVLARTTNAVTLYDGTQLPKGTTLAGKITDVRAKSSADKTSHIAFSLNRAIMHDGREVPIHATLGSFSVLSAVVEKVGNEDNFAASNSMPGLRGPGGAAPVANLIAGLTTTTEQVAGPAKTAAENAANSAGPQAGSATPAATVAAHTSAGQPISGPHIDHAPVKHLPGVTFSSALLASDTGSLDATGQNISIESWAQMTLIVRTDQK